MAENIMHRDRRSGKRFPVERTLLTVQSNKPVIIIDISAGGIAFEY